MDNFKIIFVKFDDDKKLVENLKSVMKEYDMQLKKVEQDRYTFDRDGAYSRDFIIYRAFNGWTVIHDEDDAQAESMCQELSQLSNCFIICTGIYNEDLLFYTAFNNGAQVDQYMSTMEYYEYEVDDDVINYYKGNGAVFNDVVIYGDTDKFQFILDDCRNEELDPEEAYSQIQQILGIVNNNEVESEEVDEEEEVEQDEAQEVVIGDIFYVDFNSINVRTDNRDKIIDAVREITEESGYEEVVYFGGDGEENRGFFKKILSSVSESRRIHYYISPMSAGWITLAGEEETLYGKEPVQWDFLHIEEKLSHLVGDDVVNIYGDSEKWGFRIFKEGSIIYEYSSNTEFTEINEELELFNGTDKKLLHNLLQTPADSPQAIDSIMEQFCEALKINNYKINIPMDYNDEEYKLRVLDKLPEGSEFSHLRFSKKR